MFHCLRSPVAAHSRRAQRIAVRPSSLARLAEHFRAKELRLPPSARFICRPRPPRQTMVRPNRAPTRVPTTGPPRGASLARLDPALLMVRIKPRCRLGCTPPKFNPFNAFAPKIGTFLKSHLPCCLQQTGRLRCRGTAHGPLTCARTPYSQSIALQLGGALPRPPRGAQFKPRLCHTSTV